MKVQKGREALLVHIIPALFHNGSKPLYVIKSIFNQATANVIKLIPRASPRGSFDIVSMSKDE